METFKDIKRGDIVTYKRYAGMGPQGPEYKVARAKVNPLLIFATHVVVNSGACGQVVNEDNFISVRGGKITMSFKPEVIADSTGKWCGNGLRFATRGEAEANVHDLMMRWYSVTDTRVTETSDPVTHTYLKGELHAVVNN